MTVLVACASCSFFVACGDDDGNGVPNTPNESEARDKCKDEAEKISDEQTRETAIAACEGGVNRRFVPRGTARSSRASGNGNCSGICPGRGTQHQCTARGRQRRVTTVRQPDRSQIQQSAVERPL